MKKDCVLAINLRASQALNLWREVNLDLVHKDDIDLSYRQITILLTIYLEQPPHTVRGLAKQLNVTKPVTHVLWIQWANEVSFLVFAMKMTNEMSSYSEP